jgi:D-inositol-3-phosphate glycosyltransferase
LAVISLHTSPLVQPGTGDSGGMNVYVRELVSSLAQAGVECDVYTRAWAEGLPDVVRVEPGVRVVHVPAGPRAEVPKEELPGIVGEFARGVIDHLRAGEGADALHANYWLSGVAAHEAKHELDLPLVSTFHTLARVKADADITESWERVQAETAVIGCSDVIIANGEEEATDLQRHYGASADRIEIIPPGVDHAFFSPGDRDGARAALGWTASNHGTASNYGTRANRGSKASRTSRASRMSKEGGRGAAQHPVLLFVGRIQPLKGLDVAIAALAELNDSTAELVVVGGPSGADGPAELAKVLELVERLGVSDQVRFVDPQPHHLLSTWYRAADMVIVPSRTESFGLVALEAAACGRPVVAASVGGLRTIVDDGVTGFLIDGREPTDFAESVDRLLRDPELSASMGRAAAKRAAGYTWSTAAARLRRVYGDLTSRERLLCG